MATAAVVLPAAAAPLPLLSLLDGLPPRRRELQQSRRRRRPAQAETQQRADRNLFSEALLRWRVGQALSSARFLAAALAREQQQDSATACRADERSPLAAGSPRNDEQPSPPAYEDTLDDAPPDYTSTDALATAAQTAAPPPLPPYGPPSGPPSSHPLLPLSIELLEKEARVDLSKVDNVREHKKGSKKKKQPAQKMASWAQSDDEDKKKGDGGGDNGGDGNEGGGDNGGGGDAGGGGGGGDDNGDNGDDGDEWNEAGGKKNKKKKKGKKAEEEEEEEKKAEEEEEEQEAAAAHTSTGSPWDLLATEPGDDDAPDANPDDEWAGFTPATKKKKKKGKVSQFYN